MFAAGFPEQILGARRAVYFSLENRRRFRDPVVFWRIFVQEKRAQAVI